MDNNKFCPIVKDVCKGDICMAWIGGACSILAFFKHYDTLESDNFSSGIAHGTREQILKDEEKVAQLLPECLDWALIKKITRPTRSEIKTFLIVKEVTLCDAAVRSLWRQAKIKLRESKREMDCFVSQKWRENPSNIGFSWSSDEDEALLKGFDAGQNCLNLAKIHKRSIRAIELRLEKFGKVQPAKESEPGDSSALTDNPDENPWLTKKAPN